MPKITSPPIPYRRASRAPTQNCRPATPCSRRIRSTPTPSPDYPAIPTAITRRESDLLAELTTMRWVLEIGSAWGYSTVWMALNGAHVVAVDPHTWADTRYGFEANLRRY